MSKERSLQAAQPFANALADSLADSLRRHAAGAWELKLRPDEDVITPLHATRQFRCIVSGGLNGNFWVDVSEDETTALEERLAEGRNLSTPEEERSTAPPSAEAASTEMEKIADGGTEVGQTADASQRDPVLQGTLGLVLEEAMKALGATLTAQYGATQCLLEPAVRSDASVSEGETGVARDELTVSLRLSHDGKPEAGLRVALDATLLQGLHPANGEDSEFADTDGGVPRSKKRWMDAANLELVMDVELNVSLRFGQSQLPLREVLDLASGSVIELDRDVDDPVELLLDGKVIARGEAVIVDGNYGMRITEIPEPLAGHFIR